MTHESTTAAFPVNTALMRAVAEGETVMGVSERAEEVIRSRGITAIELMYILLAHELTRPRVVVRTMSESVALKEAVN